MWYFNPYQCMLCEPTLVDRRIMRRVGWSRTDMKFSINRVKHTADDERDKGEEQEMNAVEIRFLLYQSADFRRCCGPRHTCEQMSL